MMKLKFMQFCKKNYEKANDYEKALLRSIIIWSRIDLDNCEPEVLVRDLGYLADIDADHAVPGEVRFLVIDREGDSSDDFRDHKPFRERHFDRIFTEILGYFAGTRPADFRRFVSLVFDDGYENLEAQLMNYLLFQTEFSLSGTMFGSDTSCGKWLETRLAERLAGRCKKMRLQRRRGDQKAIAAAEGQYRQCLFLMSLLSSRMRAEEKGLFPVSGSPERLSR